MEPLSPRAARAHCAVAYARRSTDRQERSIEDQLDAIYRYADEHRLVVLRGYVDDAISGLRSEARHEFQALIRDAVAPGCEFGLILTYDVKRFGRVDNDEAGHYRWLLRQAGVQVVYVAEAFGGGTLDDLIRPVKQWQAREESRDLARVTIRGLLGKIKENQSSGLWLGGFPPHGYDLRYETAERRFRFIVRYLRDGTKQLLGENGEPIALLKRREPHIVTKTDQCQLVLSAADRVEVIQRIYRMFVRQRRGIWHIAALFNARGVPTARGPEWSERCSGTWRGITIENILRNPAYTGDLVWNRRTLAKFFQVSPNGAMERLDADVRRTTRNGPELWLRANNCHPAIIDRDVWEAAQARLKA